MKRGAVTVGYLHPGSLAACFATSKTELLLFDASHKQRIMGHSVGELGLQAHAAQIDEARNKLARSMLDDSEAEWLFVVDADMGFDHDIVERLVRAANPDDRPVVGGLCFGQKTDGAGTFHSRRFRIIPTIFSMYETDTEVGFVPMLDYPRDDLVECDATGAACLLIHRSALQRVRDTYGDRWFSPLEVPKGADGRTRFSEDMSFCLRLKAAGIPLYVHTGIQTTHDKGGVFLDEHSYDIQNLTRRRQDSRFSDWILATGGLMSPMECAELDHFAAQAKGPALEVGNYTGLSTIVISNALPKGTPFTTVDTHQWRDTGDEFARNVELYGGVVQSVDGSYQEFLGSYQGPKFAWVFYDGPHTADDCEEFWQLVRRHLTDDAMILFDDADWDSMSKLTELVGAAGKSYLTRHPFRRHQVLHSSGDIQVDLDTAKRHPNTYTLAVWGNA